MSIWDSIDREAFEKNLSSLSKAKKYQDSSQLPNIECNTEVFAKDDLAIPLDVECHLATGFAFLAATTNLPRNITAAAVQHKRNPHGIRLVIAANEGLKESTGAALQAIASCLEKLAARSLSANEAETKCQEAILSIHRDRILGRLGSSKAQHQRTPSGFVLCTRLQNILKLARSTSSSPRRTGLVKALQELVQNVQIAEISRSHSKDETDALHGILQSSSDLMSAQNAFSSGLPRVLEGITASREYRELRALATYWRFCKYLVKCARRYRGSFESVDVITILPPRTSKSNGLSRHVHAEIQIVAYLETQPSGRPRYISSSKKPCFLCYCFIRAHGVYGISRSHGEVYDMWTVPDNQSYDTRARAALGQALRCTASEIQLAVIEAEEEPVTGIYSHPVQTVSKLLLDRISSVIQSTSASSQNSEQSLVRDTSRMTLMANEAPAQTRRPSPASVAAPPTGSSTSVVTTTFSERRDGDREPLNRCTSYLQVDSLELFLEVVHDEAACAPQCASISALASPLPPPSNVLRLQVDSMCCSDDILIQALPDSTGAAMILEHDMKHYLVESRWSRR